MFESQTLVDRLGLLEVRVDGLYRTVEGTSKDLKRLAISVSREKFHCQCKPGCDVEFYVPSDIKKK